MGDPDFCEICRAIPTEYYDLQLIQVFRATLKEKKYAGSCAWKAQEMATVCQYCKRAFTIGERFPVTFFSLAHLWHVLSQDTRGRLSAKEQRESRENVKMILMMVPGDMRDVWRHRNAGFSSHTMEAMFDDDGSEYVLPLCQDITFNRPKFLSEMSPDNINLRNLRKLPGKWCRPDIKCPMGCALFIDSKMTLIPFQHWLAYLFSKTYRHCRANRGYVVWEDC